MTELSLQGREKVEVNYNCQLHAPLAASPQSTVFHSQHFPFDILFSASPQWALEGELLQFSLLVVVSYMNTPTRLSIYNLLSFS